MGGRGKEGEMYRLRGESNNDMSWIRHFYLSFSEYIQGRTDVPLKGLGNIVQMRDNDAKVVTSFNASCKIKDNLKVWVKTDHY